MKKIFAILALAISSTAFAGSFTLESQNVNNVGAAGQNVLVLAVKHDFNNTFAGDVAFVNAQTEGTNALGTRLETGVTATAPLFGSVKGYTRVAYGLRYSNTSDQGYYLVEPGASMPVGPFIAKVGVRYRSATNDTDQTHTARASLGYALTKNDLVAIGYDRVKGDSNQKTVKVSYTRGF